MTRRERAMLLGALLAGAGCISTSGAQGRFAVGVAPRVVAHAGDSLTVGYTVSVVASGADSLAGFMVDAPLSARVELPGPRAAWLVMNRYKARPVASWSSLCAFWGNGQSTPELSVTARGMLGIVGYWAERNAAPDSEITDIPPAPRSQMDSVVEITGASGSTIGIVPLPLDMSPSVQATRLAALIDQSCSLGRIDNPGICRSRKAKAKAQSGPLGALLDELSAQRGKHVGESAYLLLSDNATHLLSQL